MSITIKIKSPLCVVKQKHSGVKCHIYYNPLFRVGLGLFYPLDTLVSQCQKTEKIFINEHF